MDSPENAPLVHVRQLIKIYEDPNALVRYAALLGVDIDMHAGEFISIIGPSGSGKSTLLKILAGIIPPSAGVCTVGKYDLSRISQADLRHYRLNEVGLLMQQREENLLDELSVEANIQIPMRILGVSRSIRIRRTRELMEVLGIAHRASHKPGQISGGEAQRAGLAVALANDPLLVLCDEPTGELDSVSAANVLEYLRTVNQEFGKTIIQVTHDIEAASFGDRTFRFVNKKIVGESVHGQKIQEVGRQYVLVDDDGFVHIPDEIRSKLSIGTKVKISVDGGRVILDPTLTE